MTYHTDVAGEEMFCTSFFRNSLQTLLGKLILINNHDAFAFIAPRNLSQFKGLQEAQIVSLESLLAFSLRTSTK